MPPMSAARKRARVWPVYLLAAPAFVSVWSGWVELGRMTGFGVVQPLPGIADWKLNTAITLPIGLETYAGYALYIWLSHTAASGRARRFAKWSAIGSLTLGFGGQVAYHVMAAAGILTAPWWITMVVAGLPVLVLGMGAALAHLVRAGDDEPATEPAAERPPAPLDPQVAALCEQVKRQARDARRRVLLPPAVTVGHLGYGRPVVHAVAAKPAALPAMSPAMSAATSPATEPSDDGRTLAGHWPDNGRTMAAEVAAPAATEPASKRPAGRKNTAKLVGQIAAKNPDATAAEVAAKLGIPERTARRHLSNVRAAAAAGEG